MPGSARVTLYYDVISPWTRIALEVLKRYQKPWNIDLQLKPVNIAYLMQAATNKPPMSVPAKGAYMWSQDVLRSAQYYDVTLNRPSEFPVNTSYAQLFLRHISDHSSATYRDKHIPAIDACFAAVWSNDKRLLTPEQIYDAVGSLWSADQKDEVLKLIKESGSREHKDRLKAESASVAQESGAFGLPWIVIEKDGHTSTWFGSDRFEQIAAVLGAEWKGPYPDGRRCHIDLAKL
ncbi:hypothetical protein OC846_001759 [Tilletia horrida]|uniref:Glutathione S-transferase kappa n=1 Tax=Tilletia horrida TaxID=155126 RepID=A0AAN6GUT3_9BASI|nr:hypothetical protein OC846_001759 [Tilletia horrida]KAK0568518.1 hypothetical protein OC861_001848 [Tilletia horrida]